MKVRIDTKKNELETKIKALEEKVDEPDKIMRECYGNGH